MAQDRELSQLLAGVHFDPRFSVVEGLTVFRDRLDRDTDGRVERFLLRHLSLVEDRARSGVAFIIAERQARCEKVAALRRLYATDDPHVKQGVLNGLWSGPHKNPKLTQLLVMLACDGLRQPVSSVRQHACSLIQNQAAWKVDVSEAVELVQSLLDDPESSVRRTAAFAVGNLAKSKYDMSTSVMDLSRNARDANIHVREAATWALWQLSRARHDISAAVPALIKVVRDKDDWNGPRKNAIGALLHHASKSPANAVLIRSNVAQAKLNRDLAEIQKFEARLKEIVAAK